MVGGKGKVEGEKERERVVYEGLLGRAEDGKMRMRKSGMLIRWCSCIVVVPLKCLGR